MERNCTWCSYPEGNCHSCPPTIRYHISDTVYLPKSLVSTDVVYHTSGLTTKDQDNVREIVKEELAKRDEAKNKTKGLSFEEAFTALKAGKWVARADWNGKGQYVCMLEGNLEIDTLTFRDPLLVLFNAQGEYVPWVPSMGDLFSNKWALKTSDAKIGE